MRATSRAATTAAAVGMSVLMLSATAGAASAPGSDSVGDSYYPHDGNGGYDVSHYDIDVSYQPKTDRLSGKTVVTAKATQDLPRFNLDFLLTASSVKVDGVTAGFKKDAGGELVVSPKKELAKGQQFTVVVSYDDTPHKYKLYDYDAWKQTKSGASAVDEPQIAPWWFPSNDHPTDKATYDVSIAAPKGKSVLSNGILIDKSTVDDDRTRWHWRSTNPQATYLTFFTLGDFDIPQGSSPIGKKYVTAYAKELKYAADAKASIEKTPDVIKYEEQFFGPYPFEVKGGVVTTGLGFALENQTRPVYDDVFFDGGPDTYVVAHELAHEWYGDSVSVNRWKDIWLNEGFATYAEFLWSEHEGDGTAADVAQATYDHYPADDDFWKIKPGDPGVENIWSDAVYNRGGLTLQALRTKVGDTAFFKILKAWHEQKAGGDGTTHQFIVLAEKISGKPLEKLFDTWLFTPSKPSVGPNGPASSAKATKAKAANADGATTSFAQIQRTNRKLATGESAGR